MWPTRSRPGACPSASADRELTRRPGGRDARPALRVVALDRGGGDPAGQPLPGRARARSRSTDVREIHSHPVALDQCRKLLAVAAATRSQSPSPTTGDAASTVAGLGDPTVVAIASERAARINGLTRHRRQRRRPPGGVHAVRLGRALHAPRPPRRRVAHGLLVHDRSPAGRAAHAIEPLARHRIDLNLLVSRPIPSRPFSYRFDAVLGGHPLDRNLGDAAGDARAHGGAPRLRLLPRRPQGRNSFVHAGSHGLIG